MGKKRNILSLIVKNRHLLVAIFTFFMLFFVLAGSLDVFADNIYNSSDTSEYGGNGSYESAGSLSSVFDLDSSFLGMNINSMTAGFAGGSDKLLYSPFTDYPSNYFSSSSYNSNAPYSFFVPSKVTCNDIDYIFPTTAYTFCTYSWNSADSQKWIFNYKFSSSGKIAFVCGESYYVISEQPIQFMWTRSRTDNTVTTVAGGEINEPSLNGFYCFTLEWTPVIVSFTDMPVYIASNDGSSGFTSFSASSTDFSFSNDNYNFNSLLRNGVVVDPSAPVAPESESMYHLDFKDTAYYAGDGVQNFYHNNSFSFNEYMIDNASAFTINFEYVFSYKDDTDSIVKHYVYSQSVPLANFMGYSSRMGTGGKMAVPLNCKWFVGSGGVKLSEKLNNLIHAKKGTDLQFVFPNEVNGSPDYDIGDVILNDGEITQNTKKSLPYIITPFKEYIEVFTISSNITVSDGSYNSYTYSDSYDWLTGQYSLTSSENTKKPYEKENQLPSNYDNSFNSPTSGNNVGSGAVVQNANPTIIVQGGGSGLTQAFRLDDVNIASLADTYKYIITTLGDVRDENGFWAVIHSVYHYIPDPIWNIMLLGISTVIGISVVKISLSLFHDK